MEGGEPGLPSSAPPSPRRREGKEGKGRRRGCSPQPAPLREALGNGGAAEGSGGGRGGSTPAAPGPGEAPLRDRGAAGAPRPFLTSSLEHTLPA